MDLFQALDISLTKYIDPLCILWEANLLPSGNMHVKLQEENEREEQVFLKNQHFINNSSSLEGKLSFAILYKCVIHTELNTFDTLVHFSSCD